MSKLKDMAADAKKIMIAAHVRPDGDSVGSCVAVYHYLKKIYPEKKLDVYIELLPEVFKFLDSEGEIFKYEITDEKYDLFISLDCSSTDRLGAAEKVFSDSAATVCVDHHISNKGYAENSIVEPEASSTCEVLFGLMDENEIDFDIARALYIGIIFDSGVFRYSNTSRKTMEIAGKLMEKGIPFWEYIDKCFYQRTYTQTQLLGRTLLTSMRIMNGKCIVANITRRMLAFYGAKTEDIEGIIDQLRVTEGVEAAILLQETGEQEYKVSLRSNDYVDVSAVATYFGGGGHRKASGFTMRGSLHDVVNNITVKKVQFFILKNLMLKLVVKLHLIKF